MMMWPTPSPDDWWQQGISLLSPTAATRGRVPAPALEPIIGALQEILLYTSSIAIVIGVLALVWQTVRVVTETAWSGEAISRDWHAIWGPLRIVGGLTMIMPVAGGMSLAQILMIEVARAGGAVASHIHSLYLARMSAARIDVATDRDRDEVRRAFQAITSALACAATATVYQHDTSGLLARLGDAAASLTRGRTLGQISRDYRDGQTTWSVALRETAGPVCPSISLATPWRPDEDERYRRIRERLTVAIDTHIREVMPPLTRLAEIATRGAAASRETISAHLTAIEEITTRSVDRWIAARREALDLLLSDTRDAADLADARRYGWLAFPAMTWAATARARDAAVIAAVLPATRGWDVAGETLRRIDHAPLAQAIAATEGLIGGRVISDITAPAPAEGVLGAIAAWGALPTVDLRSGSPMLQMTAWAAGVSASAERVAIAAVGAGAVGSLLSGLPILGTAVTIGGGTLSTAGSLAMWPSLVAAIATGVVAYVVPLIPAIAIITLGLSTLILLVEAIIAAPIWALAHVTLRGLRPVGDTALPGYRIIASLALRLPIGVIGAIAALIAVDVVLWLGLSLAARLTASTQATLTSTLLLLVVTAVLMWQLVTRAFSLVTDLPDRVLRWIGVPSADAGADTQTTTRVIAAAMPISRSIAGSAAGAVSQAGGGIGRLAGAARPRGLPPPPKASKLPR